MRMKVGDAISREEALRAIEEICYALWEIDIPSPTVPEYVEHHEQVQRVMKLAEEWGTALRDMPSEQFGLLEANREEILQAGMEGREVELRIGGRLFAIREKAQ